MGPSGGNGGRWYRRFHRARASADPLVCFPYAGGSAAYYHAVSAALSPRTDVVAVQYPGRQDRISEPCIDDIHLLADRIHAALADVADRPLALFGHSMGALVAFEVARRIESSGGSVRHLFLSGRRAPSCTRNDETIHLLGEAELLATVVAMGGTDQRLLESEEMRSLVLTPLRSDYRAVETYRGTVTAAVRCPVTVLTGADDETTTVEEARAWRRHTSGPCEVRVFPGGHFYLNERRDEVLRVLTDTLESTAARP
ncbi:MULTISPECIES: alpha/beta fold hydrolase [unclassified Streptomyces]